MAVLDAPRAGRRRQVGAPRVGGQRPRRLQALWLRCTVGQQHLRWSALRELVELLDVGLDGLDPVAARHAGRGTERRGRRSACRRRRRSSRCCRSRASVRPLLILIDDAQWIDEASRSGDPASQTRRIDYDPVVLLMAEAVEERGRRQLPSRSPCSWSHGLSPIDAVTLLEGQVATKVAEELALVTEGNPSGDARDRTRAFAGAALGRSADLASVLPLSEVLLSSFERRTAGLSDEQRRAAGARGRGTGSRSRVRLRAAAAEAGFDPGAGRDGRGLGVAGARTPTVGSSSRARSSGMRCTRAQILPTGGWRTERSRRSTTGARRTSIGVRGTFRPRPTDGPGSGCRHSKGVGRPGRRLAVDARTAGRALRRAAALTAEPRATDPSAPRCCRQRRTRSATSYERGHRRAGACARADRATLVTWRRSRSRWPARGWLRRGHHGATVDLARARRPTLRGGRRRTRAASLNTLAALMALVGRRASPGPRAVPAGDRRVPQPDAGARRGWRSRSRALLSALAGDSRRRRRPCCWSSGSPTEASGGVSPP